MSKMKLPRIDTQEGIRNETWKDIPGYENRYQVSELGNVRNLRRRMNSAIQRDVFRKGCIIKKSKTRFGYLSAPLSTNNKSKIFNVHRLVAMAFIPNPENKACVNHKNGIKTDNRVENLEWCTHSENTKHAFKIGLNAVSTGQFHGSAKLTDAQIKEIQSRTDSGELNYKDIPAIYGVTRSYAHKIAYRKLVRTDSILRKTKKQMQNDL